MQRILHSCFVVLRVSSYCSLLVLALGMMRLCMMFRTFQASPPLLSSVRSQTEHDESCTGVFVHLDIPLSAVSECAVFPQGMNVHTISLPVRLHIHFIEEDDVKTASVTSR